MTSRLQHSLAVSEDPKLIPMRQELFLSVSISVRILKLCQQRQLRGFRTLHSVFQVQSKVLPKYGFQGSLKGVFDMLVRHPYHRELLSGSDRVCFDVAHGAEVQEKSISDRKSSADPTSSTTGSSFGLGNHLRCVWSCACSDAKCNWCLVLATSILRHLAISGPNSVSQGYTAASALSKTISARGLGRRGCSLVCSAAPSDVII